MKIVGEKVVHDSPYLFDSLPILFDSVSKTATRTPLAKTLVYRAFSVDEIQAAGMNQEPFVSRKPCAHLQSPMGAHSPDVMSRTAGVSADENTQPALLTAPSRASGTISLVAEAIGRRASAIWAGPLLSSLAVPDNENPKHKESFRGRFQQYAFTFSTTVAKK